MTGLKAANARVIMLQGTGSDVGKSLIGAGLCRAFTNRGLRVRPFKPQNMSNNAAVTADGGEIGRAQALQARGCRVPPTTDMNPVLLKPQGDNGAQLIVQGQMSRTLSARAYFHSRGALLAPVMESFHRLSEEAELIIVEGAGSPAEINLRQRDIANMGFARAAGAPVLLIADIHRGGVMAAIVGSFSIMEKSDSDLIKAFIINKFHGDISLFDEGKAYLETVTRRPCLGIVPHFSSAALLPAEDSLALEPGPKSVAAKTATTKEGALVVAVPRLPHIANFDDLDPLRHEPGIDLRFIQSGNVIPACARLIVLAGSKATLADLAALRREGWDIDILAHVRRGGHVLGLCGGYQLLGRRINDPLGLEGSFQAMDGLGLLDIETTLSPGKILQQVQAKHAASGERITAYEIHLGDSHGPDRARPFAYVAGKPEGAISPCGRVTGTYLHGAFSADAFRNAYIAALKARPGAFAFDHVIEQTLDELAQHLETHLDLEQLLKLAAPVRTVG